MISLPVATVTIEKQLVMKDMDAKMRAVEAVICIPLPHNPDFYRNLRQRSFENIVE